MVIKGYLVEFLVYLILSIIKLTMYKHVYKPLVNNVFIILEARDKSLLWDKDYKEFKKQVWEFLNGKIKTIHNLNV